MSLAHFKLLDWDFPEQNSNIFLHNLCWYPSRFIPMIPAQLITALSKPGDTVLDPFCGSGTVLIEALRQNRNSICLDLNTYGCFIAETKARIYSGGQFDLLELTSIIEEIDAINSDDNNASLFSHPINLLKQTTKLHPNIESLTPWYHKRTLSQLSALYTRIDNIEHELTKNILQLIFISISMASSGHKTGRPYTYYADNVKPKALEEKDAYTLFKRRLKKFLNEYKNSLHCTNNTLDWNVFNGDSRQLSNQVQTPVDLIVTSPPYLGVTDYTMAFRLGKLWLDFGNPLESIKTSEIGARWRRKRSDETTSYLRDMEKCFSEMTLCLKPNKYLCIVIGESKKNSEKINNHLLSYIEEKLGLTLVHSTSRQISQKFFRHPNGGVDTEEIYIFQKQY
ncbi:MAG: DNA methyltransferase [Sedimenticola sp.]|nr:DNA methyltransferase [Sedimenticola sp.]